MQGDREPRGFTIIEIMIFLAISGALLIIALNSISGKQDSTEFTTSLNSFVSNLRSSISYISDGYYQSPAGITCSANPGRENDGAWPRTGAYPNITGTTGGSQGTQLGCTYIGEVLEFGIQNSGVEEYKTYPVVGLQYDQGGASLPLTNATNLTQAVPTLVTSSADTSVLGYGISVKSICYSDTNYTPGFASSSQCSYLGGTNVLQVGAIGFFTTFNGYNTAVGGNGLLNEGSQSIDLIPIPGSTEGMLPSNLANAVNPLCNTAATSPTNTSCAINNVSDGYIASAGNLGIINPDLGITLCIDSGSTNQSALVTIGGSSGPTLVADKIQGNQCA